MKITEQNLRKVISRCLRESSFMQTGLAKSAQLASIGSPSSYSTDTGNVFSSSLILTANEADIDEDEDLIDEDEDTIEEEECT